VPGSDGYGPTFAALRKANVDAVLVPSFPRFFREHLLIVEEATKRRLPAIFEWGEIARAGGLMAYGPTLAELHRRVATYVDKILKGAKPGDLPVEQPTKLELVVNLKTAKTLRLTIPPVAAAAGRSGHRVNRGRPPNVSLQRTGWLVQPGRSVRAPGR